jgi:hypothetical protein
VPATQPGIGRQHFQGEGGSLNMGLGRGPALDIFSASIEGFEVVP